MKEMTIGQLARRAGVGVETVRYYERRGLVPTPPRPEWGGFRRYPASAAATIRFIRQAQNVGFTLAEIRELLALRADPRADCRAVRDRAEARLTDVERKMADLARMHGALRTLIAACPGQGALRECTILEALHERAGEQPGTEDGQEELE